MRITIQERVARAIETDVDTMQSRRDDPSFDDRTQVYLDGYRAGMLDAARVARDTPDDVTDDEAQAIAREMREAFPDDGTGEVRY